jgi:ABC-type dipeptide/oligopeptide/nickel transport system permease subunit
MSQATMTIATEQPVETLAGSLGEMRAPRSLWSNAWRQFRRNKLAMFGLCYLVFLVFVAIFAPAISPHNPVQSDLKVAGKYRQAAWITDADPKKTGDWSYPLGTDGNGRDILTRLAYGGRVSLMIAILSATTLFLLGGVIGLISGYLGGVPDMLIMRLVDVLLSIPGLPLLILIATLFSPGPVGLAFVLALVGWPGIARLVRSEVLAKREAEYVDAARTLGASTPRIVFRHILPNVLPLLIVYTSLSIPGLILAETGLSFIGIGVQVPTPSWGNMLGDAQQFYRTNASNVLIPGAMIYITSLSLNLVGNGLRDAFDPKLTQ